MKLHVGDVVVYASHGIGRIESIDDADGQVPARLVLVFENDMRVTLPLDRAHETLRGLSGEDELEEVRRTLRAEAEPSVDSTSQRNRRANEKLVAGGVSGLAEIVREGVQREQRLAGNSRGGPATDSQLYRRARMLLAAEIAACRGIDPEAAEAWIIEQVVAGHA